MASISSAKQQQRSFYSASYAGKNDWEAAAADAKECIRLEPTFSKGYYRLATAQMEMKDWDGAVATIKQGLVVDANNPQLGKLLRTIKQSKKAADKIIAAAKKASPTVASSSASKEFVELQQQYMQTNREFNIVKANIVKAQREKKSQEITKSELETLLNDDYTQETKMYRSVGKMFLRASRDQVFEHLTKTIEDEKKRESDLTQKLDYLERRLKSQRQNMEEVMQSQSPLSAEE